MVYVPSEVFQIFCSRISGQQLWSKLRNVGTENGLGELFVNGDPCLIIIVNHKFQNVAHFPMGRVAFFACHHSLSAILISDFFLLPNAYQNYYSPEFTN